MLHRLPVPRKRDKYLLIISITYINKWDRVAGVAGLEFFNIIKLRDSLRSRNIPSETASDPSKCPTFRTFTDAIFWIQIVAGLVLAGVMYRDMGAEIWSATHDTLVMLGYLLLGLASVAAGPVLTSLSICIFGAIVVWWVMVGHR